MATKKIGLNELRNLVKQIIKENEFDSREDSLEFALRSAGSLEEIDEILNQAKISKGELMKIAYNGNIRNVDAATPMSLWKKFKPYGGTFYFVMDYQDNSFGKLVHLGEKILGQESDWNSKLA